MSAESPRARHFPAGLSRRVVQGHVLYAPVVSFDLGSHTLVFVSGLLSRDAEGNIVGAGDMGAQIARVGENLAIALGAAGATLADLVRTQTLVTDIEAFFQHVDVRQKFFGAALPTSTTVEVRRLSHPDFLVEIEALAIVPSSKQGAAA